MSHKILNATTGSHHKDEADTEDDLTPWTCPEYAIQPPSETPSTLEYLNQLLNPEEIALLVDDYVKDIGRDGKITVFDIKSNMKEPQEKGFFDATWDDAEQSARISQLFDRLRKPREDDVVEVLYQSGADMGGKSIENVDAGFLRDLDITRPKQNNSEIHLDDFKNLPQSFMEALSSLLDNKSRTQCREVCKIWNKQISCSDAFLNNAVFIMGPTLELVQRCKKTQVKWRNIKCQLLPCPEFYSTKSYQQKYIVTKLVRGPKTFFTASIHSITLDHFEIQKENLLKWLTLCTQVTQLEFIGCSFKKSKVSSSKEILQKVADRLKDIKFKEMSLASIVEAGKLLLMFARKLKTLEVSQKGVDHTMTEVSFLRTKTLEDEFSTMIRSALEVNLKSLKSVGLVMEVFQTFGLQGKLFARVGSIGLNLHEFQYIVQSPSKNTMTIPLGPDPLQIIHKVLDSSKELKKLRVPSLNLDFSNVEDISWSFPNTIRELEAQLKTPMRENEIKHKIRQRFVLKSMDLHGKIFVDSDWVDFRQCHPWVTELSISCDGTDDSHIQSVIKNMPSLYSLTFNHLSGVTDFGITGIEPRLLARMETLWSGSGVDGFNSESEKLKYSGLPLGSMKWLRSFKCRGEFKFTDIGVRYGLGGAANLETLELSGSELIVSQSGLQFLASNCLKLKSLMIQLSRKNMDSKVVEDVTKQMRFMPCKGVQIKFL